MCPEQGTGEGGEGGLGVYRHLTQAGFAHKGGGPGRQASDPSEAFHARPQVSCCRFLVQGARS